MTLKLQVARLLYDAQETAQAISRNLIGRAAFARIATFEKNLIFFTKNSSYAVNIEAEYDAHLSALLSTFAKIPHSTPGDRPRRRTTPGS